MVRLDQGLDALGRGDYPAARVRMLPNRSASEL